MRKQRKSLGSNFAPCNEPGAMPDSGCLTGSRAKMFNNLSDDDLLMGLLETALSYPPEQREAYLLRACADDPAVREEVWKYVQAEQRMNGFLLEPLFSL